MTVLIRYLIKCFPSIRDFWQTSSVAGWVRISDITLFWKQNTGYALSHWSPYNATRTALHKHRNLDIVSHSLQCGCSCRAVGAHSAPECWRGALNNVSVGAHYETTRKDASSHTFGGGGYRWSQYLTASDRNRGTHCNGGAPPLRGQEQNFHCAVRNNIT